MLQELWSIPLRPNPREEIIVKTSGERGFSHPWQALLRHVLLTTLRRIIQRQSYGCILLWLINDKRLLVMAPLLLLFMMMSYVLFDWNIVAYTGFYACVCFVSRMCRCLITDSWGLCSVKAKERERYFLYKRQHWIPGKPSSLVGLSAIRNLHYSVNDCC